MHLLYDNSHSIINASLDIINLILNCTDGILKKYLTSLEHLDIVRKRKSLRNVIFNRNSTESKTNSRKSSAETFKIQNKFEKTKMEIDIIAATVDDEAQHSPLKTTEDDDDNGAGLKENVKVNDTIEMENRCKSNKELFLDVKEQQQHESDEKSLTFSDNEIDSFKSMDFGSNVTVSPTFSFKDKILETTSLNRQKSTESIGSFINTLLHPNTGKSQTLK